MSTRLLVKSRPHASHVGQSGSQIIVRTPRIDKPAQGRTVLGIVERQFVGARAARLHRRVRYNPFTETVESQILPTPGASFYGTALHSPRTYGIRAGFRV